MTEIERTAAEADIAIETEKGETQRRKTLAVRLDETTHAQLQFIAQLNGNSLADEIRRAINARIDQAQEDPDLIDRAQLVRQEIEREAAARAAAISGFLGSTALADAAATPAPVKRAASRSRTSKEG